MRVLGFYSLVFLILVAGHNIFGMSSRPLYVTPSEDYWVVQPGDKLSTVSRRSGISEENLKLYNNLDDEELRIGQKIYYRPQIAKSHLYVTEQEIPENGEHRVEAGESLADIARKYDVDLMDLIQYNSISSWELQAGEIICLRSGMTERKKLDKPKSQNSGIKETQAAEKINASDGRVKSSMPVRTKPGKFMGIESSPVSNFVISQRFNQETRHQGIDLAAPKGTPILAVLDGKVVFSGTQKGYGNLVILEHPNRVLTVYAHNERNLASTGDIVKAGDQIAEMGSTGRSTGDHLHFEIRQAGQPMDPEPYIKEVKG